MKLIFLCSLKNKAYGGLDVIINFYDYFKSNNIQTVILDLKKISFIKEIFRKPPDRYKKFKLEFIKSYKDIKKNDIVIVPEIYVNKFANYFCEKNIKYYILIQNLFLIRPQDIKDYFNADMLISTSKHITEGLRLFFPQKKILTLRLHVKTFHRPLKKTKVISYMPRKLTMHGSLITSLLENIIPNHWRIKKIENLDHNDVLRELSKSSIFLSITDFEGFGLPAMEAGLLGNFVVGYSGVGGNEFFCKPIFNKIEFGDINNFIKTVLAIINEIDKGLISETNLKKQIKILKEYYSENNQIHSLQKLVKEFKNNE